MNDIAHEVAFRTSLNDAITAAVKTYKAAGASAEDILSALMMQAAHEIGNMSEAWERKQMLAVVAPLIDDAVERILRDRLAFAQPEATPQ
jgi:hypothetical protein